MKKITKVLAVGLAVFGMLSFFGCGNTTSTPPNTGNNNTPNSISQDDFIDCTKSTTKDELEKENLSGAWDCVQKVENKTIGTSADAPTGTLIVTGILTLEKTDGQTYKAYYASGTQMILEFTSDTEFTDEQKQIIESNLSAVDISRAASSRAVSYSNGNRTAKITITLSENKAFKSNGSTDSLTTPVDIKEIIGDGAKTNDGMTKFSGDKLGFVQRTSILDEVAEFEASIERAISAAQKDCKPDSSVNSIAEGEWEMICKNSATNGVKKSEQSYSGILTIEKKADNKYKCAWKGGIDFICLTRFEETLTDEDKNSFDYNGVGKWFDNDTACYQKSEYTEDVVISYYDEDKKEDVDELTWNIVKQHIFIAKDEDDISVNSDKTKYYFYCHDSYEDNGDTIEFDVYTILVKRN